MSDKKQMGFRAQQHIAAEIEEYAEQRDISQSEALRRIVEVGLEDMTGAEPTKQQTSGKWDTKMEQNMDAGFVVRTLLLTFTTALAAFIGAGGAL